MLLYLWLYIYRWKYSDSCFYNVFQDIHFIGNLLKTLYNHALTWYSHMIEHKTRNTGILWTKNFVLIICRMTKICIIVITYISGVSLTRPNVLLSTDICSLSLLYLQMYTVYYFRQCTT
jgi:hypothetical protein